MYRTVLGIKYQLKFAGNEISIKVIGVDFSFYVFSADLCEFGFLK